MSQIISISISSELHERVKKYKKNINVSRICQKAIIEAVANEETRTQTNDEIDKLAIRYKNEREEYGKDFKLEGFKDGTKDALGIDFQWIYTLSNHWGAVSPEELFEMGALKETREKIENGQLETDLDFFISFDDVKDLYFEGWGDGIIDVWNRVRERMSI